MLGKIGNVYTLSLLKEFMVFFDFTDKETKIKSKYYKIVCVTVVVSCLCVIYLKSGVMLSYCLALEVLFFPFLNIN
jgi:hypothetical protein